MAVRLEPDQMDALRRMHNGCILCGGTGTGKSITGLAYYFKLNGGDFGTTDSPSEGYVPMTDRPMDLYIITPATKRNKREWNLELARYLIVEGNAGEVKDARYFHNVKVDSWNNIKKYKNIKGAFFIFDEDKVTGDKTWADTFIDIARVNQWIILSATPGDCWKDYMSVFIANGYYRNKTEFRDMHIIYNPHVPYPDVKSYINIGRLIRLRNKTVVNMDSVLKTKQHHEFVYCNYNKELYLDIARNRWNYTENRPIENASEYCYQLRQCVNDEEDRIVKVMEIFEDHPKVIIFYNFNYELEALKSAFEYMSYDDSPVDFKLAEWNGRVHQDIPTCESWVYLVQYNACEAWNCINTDTIIFYSQNYSYKNMVQAAGRIDRRNTPYIDLYYYHLVSASPIDGAIRKALNEKKKFNETKFAKF